MKNSMKGIILIVISLGMAGVGYKVIDTNHSEYSILCFVIALIAITLGINYLVKNRNPEQRYESGVKDILNTYDSILVKSNKVPDLKDRNIINLESVEDLIDAQLEIRKPICYLKQTESCSFILLDEKEAYVYIEKLNDNVVSPVEIELKEMKIKNKSAEEMDSEMLRDIEKTTIVKLSNKKSYKVSPIRKKNIIQEEIEVLDF